MSRRGGALALALAAADLAASSCAGARRWAGDEADRIDAVMARGAVEVDAGSTASEGAAPVAMGPSPPLAPPTSPFKQLKPNTPWSVPPFRRGTRWYLGRRRAAPAVGRDAAAEERVITR